MMCVCGCSRDAHRTAAMSVLITATEPRYKVVGHSDIFNNYNSTYIRDECTQCGCSFYEADTELASLTTE